ncbi:TPA_inf: hypothetical protein gp_08 [Marinomonas phage YY]|nr:TPA_inf: hypothetical protein gp_08 [Marinomonas phage YY]
MIFGSYKFDLSQDPIPAEYLVRLSDVEQERLQRLSDRGDVHFLTVMNKSCLAAYAALGRDANGMLTIYAAHSFVVGLGAAAISGLFQGATYVDAPMRVHADDEARAKAYAKMAGVDLSKVTMTTDADGVGQGVYNGV